MRTLKTTTLFALAQLIYKGINISFIQRIFFEKKSKNFILGQIF